MGGGQRVAADCVWGERFGRRREQQRGIDGAFLERAEAVLYGGDPSSANAIQEHLTSLVSKCREGETHLAAFIDFAYEDLRKHADYEPMRKVAADLDSAVPRGMPHFDCQGATAAFLVLAESGSG